MKKSKKKISVLICSFLILQCSMPRLSFSMQNETNEAGDLTKKMIHSLNTDINSLFALHSCRAKLIQSFWRGYKNRKKLKLPTFVLATNAPDGVGDLVHLEEYIKHLKRNYADKLNIIGIAKIDIDNVHALKRAEALQQEYASLDIRTFSYDSKKITNFLTPHEKTSLLKVISVSDFCINTDDLKNNEVLRNSGLEEYCGYPNSGFRFYKNPGETADNQREIFWNNLRKEAPRLYEKIISNNNRQFLPAHFSRKEALVAFIDIFTYKFGICDFYVPSHLLIQEIKDIIKKHNNNHKIVFISPRNIEATIESTDESDATVRIFSEFDLSNETYKGLYLYTHGDVVGYQGDDTFTLALSSTKLPFPDAHNPSQRGFIRKLAEGLKGRAFDEVAFDELHDHQTELDYNIYYNAYKLALEESLAWRSAEKNIGNYLTIIAKTMNKPERLLRMDKKNNFLTLEEIESKKDEWTKFAEEMDLETLKKSWSVFAQEMYTNQNGFKILDTIVKNQLELL